MTGAMTKEEMFDKYLENVDAYVNWKKLRNGDDPDEAFMRSVETKIVVSNQAKKYFREDIIIKHSRHNRKGWRFTLESDERLKTALMELEKG